MGEPSTPVAPGFVWRDSAVGRVLTNRGLDDYAAHVFTSRDTPFRGPFETANYGALARELGVSSGEVVLVRQVHGCAVHVASAGRNPTQPDADAVVTTDPTTVIAVRVADCVPILLADRNRRLVAAVHAGWRGTVAGVARATVDRIWTLGVSPADLVAAIGPSAGPCCYQVDGPVRDAFMRGGGAAASLFREDGAERWRLDLWEANRDQLIDAGIPPSSISVAGLCSVHLADDLFSYRREGPAVGRMVAAIRIKT